MFKGGIITKKLAETSGDSGAVLLPAFLSDRLQRAI